MPKFIYAVSTLSGTIIGVGLFSLPYITLKVGIGVILGYFLILGTLVILIHLFFGELALKTPDFKRLPGFARIYLGKAGEKVAIISTILGLFGAILAYLIVGGDFLANLLSPFFGGGPLFYTLLYFILGALLIFFGIKAIARVEFLGLILFLAILIVLFILGFPSIKITNFVSRGDFSFFFLPYGAVLFSLWGASLIPQAEEILGDEKRLMRKMIIWAILIPIFIYLFFIFMILGITGSQTTESALVGLKNFLSPVTVTLGLVFGLLTTFTSFIALGLTLKNVLCYDLKLKEIFSWFLSCFIPLILFLIGIKSFIAVISFVGGVMLGVDGILILLMYNKIRPERRLLVYFLTLILLAGIIYQVIYFTPLKSLPF